MWTGDLHLKDSDLRFDAFAEPIRIAAADAEFDSAGTSIKRLSMKVAGVEVQGDYRYQLRAAAPHQFRLTAGAVDGSTVEKLLAPALNRASLLNKTLNLGKVRCRTGCYALHAEGTLQLASLALGPVTLNRLKTRLEWTGRP